MTNQLIKQEDIFSRLHTKRVTYAVCVALNCFASVGVERYSRDYFILCAKLDAKRLQGLNFDGVLNQRKILTRPLSPDEVRLFLRSQHKYKKVIHNGLGRVYELKTQPFKKHFKSLEHATERH